VLDGGILEFLFCGEPLGGVLPPCLSLSFRNSVLEIFNLLGPKTGNGTLVLEPGEVRTDLVGDR